MPKQPQKKRDAARTQAAILDAARWLLTRRSYDQVGVRELGQRAGVDGALVQRYFGSKRALFAEAIRGGYAVAALLTDGDRASLPARLADHAVHSAKDRSNFDPTLVLLRSASCTEVQKVLRGHVEDEFIAPLAQVIGGERGRLRAVMVLACLAGFDLARSVLKLEDARQDDAERLLEKLLTVCLDG